MPEDLKISGKLRDVILKSQRTDGSWVTVEDLNLNQGDLNATLWNYLALRAMPHGDVKLDIELALKKAQSFILKGGGIEKCNLLSKYFLAAMQLYDWKKLPRIPELILNPRFPINTSDFGQWVGPHLKAMAYLRAYRMQKGIGFDSKKLFNQVDQEGDESFSSEKLLAGEEALKIQSFLLKDQQPLGSWGGYTVSTLFNIMVLYKSGLRLDHPALKKALAFIEYRYFANGVGSYLGSLQDGRYWDSILAGQALLESGINGAQLLPTLRSLLANQQPNGGIPFGRDFEYAPDVDDTAELIIFLVPFSRTRGDFSHQISNSTRDLAEERMNKALDWIESMQNQDGGWGAFARNNRGNFLIDQFTKSFADSVDFFDESSPDVTGHVLEAMGRMGFKVSQLYFGVQRGISYLKQTQDQELGSWTGRWGINHVYGTGSALVGLLAVGEDPAQPYIKKAVNWLKSIQNTDGGFGESTESYRSRQWIGRGVSTPSQTAWALNALIAAGEVNTEAVKKAVSYLLNDFLNDFQKKGGWKDSSTVGTGHPGIVYMNYPSYPLTFPLMALARYRAELRGHQEITFTFGAQ